MEFNSGFKGLNEYNSNQQIHSILLKFQKYYKTPTTTCFGSYWPITREHPIV